LRAGHQRGISIAGAGLYTQKGKSSTKFVKKEDLPTVCKQLKNYERMKLLMEKWIDLAMELSILQLAKKPTE